jgi:hypothetical protein
VLTTIKTFAAVFLAVILAVGLIFFLRGVASFNKERAETSQFLFNSAIDHEAWNWAWHHEKEDPDQQIFHKRIEQIKKAQEAGDMSPPKFPDSYATLRQAVILPDGSATLAAGTGVEFVAFQDDGTIHVRYSGVDMTLPTSVVQVK